MKLHELKIEERYATEKSLGYKMFEIRKNDRDFQLGDLVHYTVVEDKEEDEAENIMCKVISGFPLFKPLDRMPFESKLYRITYITDYEQKDGYVVFGEEEVKVVKV